MTDSSVSVTRFKNRNGAVSWRVSGWLAGIRIRRNFKSCEEAAAERASLDARVLQLAWGLRTATTFEQGVTADDIARTLGVNIDRIRASMNLLKGIRPTPWRS